MVGYSNKTNNNKTNMLCVVGNIGLMEHVVLFDPTQTEFFINKTSSLMNKVSFGTVIPCIRGEV